jgi:hypothetical protein
MRVASGRPGFRRTQGQAPKRIDSMTGVAIGR